MALTVMVTVKVTVTITATATVTITITIVTVTIMTIMVFICGVNCGVYICHLRIFPLGNIAAVLETTGACTSRGDYISPHVVVVC
ncbi:hypothetical protein UAMX_001991 [Candidatus Uabimicrobium amorphum]|uniref:hypothetical protein n=1 Tax=Uabimicrobium amorphum TaxID=2596890 RepID=UPI001E2A5143|nr:hypothetical protein [Candidatus Uabimicrobium amorphum]